MNNRDILQHPLLVHQQAEGRMVLRYAKDLLFLLQKKREDLIQPIIIDILIKLFRREVCNFRLCGNCVVCDPSVFMRDTDFMEFITIHKNEIIAAITGGFNNSFNVPQRGIYIQKVIDKLFQKDENLIIFEIGCGAGQIGKFLTNSNLSKCFFNFDFQGEEKDNRFVQYYGIDPNLQKGIKNQLMMINGSSEEMKTCRKVLREFNTLIQDEERMLLEKTILNHETFPMVVQNLKKMYSNIKSGNSSIIFLTSVMKYHFRTREQHDDFMKILLELAQELQSINGGTDVYYISNEVYGKNGGLYPFESSDYGKLQIMSSVFEKGTFLNQSCHSEYTWFF